MVCVVVDVRARRVNLLFLMRDLCFQSVFFCGGFGLAESLFQTVQLLLINRQIIVFMFHNIGKRKGILADGGFGYGGGGVDVSPGKGSSSGRGELGESDAVMNEGVAVIDGVGVQRVNGRITGGTTSGKRFAVRGQIRLAHNFAHTGADGPAQGILIKERTGASPNSGVQNLVRHIFGQII